MLHHVAKGVSADADPVTPDEDHALRAAFGRYGGSATARMAAMPVVARYQTLGAGRWFLCDCRPGVERRPALIPVALTHIRRHDDPRWSRHAEGCEFNRDPDEQREIIASHRRPGARPFRLARRFTPLWTSAFNREVKACSQASKRPGLAKLLLTVMESAGLQTVPAGRPPPPVPEQVAAIWKAAKTLELDEAVRVTDFLCTGIAQYPAFLERIRLTDPGVFAHTRPHGILLLRLVGIGTGSIQPVSGPALPVIGRLAVFGEDAADATRARAPYLAACLVSQIEADGAIGIVSAYVHPCASKAHLMLVDSDAERRTLAQLQSVQIWLQREDSIEATIDKPLFDVGPETGPEDQPRPSCVPDFVVRGGGRTVIVETMGYADEDYRTRKVRVHAALSTALAGAPVVEHDFHLPVSWEQDWRDKRFRRDVRQVVSGGARPGLAGSGGRPAPGRRAGRNDGVRSPECAALPR